jgi:beta-1,4-mannooligosaccharide/beta-1,4-mannosyl-N-acetylglucosamine phosphorylase
LPWEERPTSSSDIVWRYSKNPIIPRNLIPSSNSIFNSAAVPFGDGFAGVFRCDNKKREMNLHRGFSHNGIDWQLDNDPIAWLSDVPEIARYQYRYDYVMLNRPSDNGHTPFGDIYLSQSKDMVYWGEHRFVMGTRGGWESTKIGAGPIPIATPEGWLMIYHGVLTSCNGFVYAFGAALLDLDEPWKVVRRGEPYLLVPQTLYECVGDVPNVAFPCAALYDEPTQRMAVYYGGADTVTALAFCKMDELLDWLKANG